MRVAGQVLNGWKPTEATTDALTEQDVGELQRMFAQSLIHTVEEAAHLSSVMLTNDMVYNATLMDTEEGRNDLHLVAMAEGRRVDTLLNLLREVDTMCLSLCEAFNEIIEDSTDEDVTQRVRGLHNSVIMSEDVIRRNIEHNERRWG